MILDSAGNTWTLAVQTSSVGSNTNTSAIYYCINPTTSATHTFTATGPGPALNFPVIGVQAWDSGGTAPALDKTNGSQTGGGAASVQPGSVTPAQNGELIFAAFGSESGATTYTVNSSMTISTNIDYAGGLHEGGACAYLVQTSAAAINPTWSVSGSGQLSAAIATFNQPAAAATGRPFVIRPQR